MVMLDLMSQIHGRWILVIIRLFLLGSFAITQIIQIHLITQCQFTWYGKNKPITLQHSSQLTKHFVLQEIYQDLAIVFDIYFDSELKSSTVFVIEYFCGDDPKFQI